MRLIIVTHSGVTTSLTHSAMANEREEIVKSSKHFLNDNNSSRTTRPGHGYRTASRFTNSRNCAWKFEYFFLSLSSRRQTYFHSFTLHIIKIFHHFLQRESKIHSFSLYLHRIASFWSNNWRLLLKCCWSRAIKERAKLEISFRHSQKDDEISSSMERWKKTGKRFWDLCNIR